MEFNISFVLCSVVMWFVRCSFCIGNKNHQVYLLIVLLQETSNKLLVIYNNLIFNENVSTHVSWKQFSWRNNFQSQNIISLAFHVRKAFCQELWEWCRIKAETDIPQQTYLASLIIVRVGYLLQLQLRLFFLQRYNAQLLQSVSRR